MLKTYSKLFRFTVLIIGYFLSPFSWWNDIYFNFPVAYILTIPFVKYCNAPFTATLLFFYWLSNVIGLVMMHFSSKLLLIKRKVSLTQEAKNVFIVSTLYSIIYYLLINFGLISIPDWLMKT